MSKEPGSLVAGYEKKMLERANLHWELEDWPSLLDMNMELLENHPDRAELALYIGVAYINSGNREISKKFVDLSIKWGVDKTLLFKVFVAGVHATLARANLAANKNDNAFRHYERSIGLFKPYQSVRLLSETKMSHDAIKMGLLPQAFDLLVGKYSVVQESSREKDDPGLRILKTELDMLRHELSLAQQRMQLYKPDQPGFSRPVNGNAGGLIVEAKKNSVSQLGQDVWVLERTGFKKNGFFVEFGATDGVLLSNSWMLEKFFDWQGICAEPNPDFYARLLKNRNCKVSNQYIGAITGEKIDFVLADVFGGSAEFIGCDHHKEKREAYLKAGKTIALDSISLNDFLVFHCAPKDIDYISIDTEGSEYSILKNFPFERWNVKLFTIEHNFTNQRDFIFSLMQKHGYIRTESQWDDWYEKP